MSGIRVATQSFTPSSLVHVPRFIIKYMRPGEYSLVLRRRTGWETPEYPQLNFELPHEQNFSNSRLQIGSENLRKIHDNFRPHADATFYFDAATVAIHDHLDEI